MTKQPDFAPGTLGDFLVLGQHGWPQEYAAHLDGARISVVRSELRAECQSCTCHGITATLPNTTSDETLPYLRVSLDVNVSQAGHEQLLHIEELFPWHILPLLHSQLDQHAAARVRRAISEALLALDAQEPIARLLSCPVAPMRLYEPLLNALIRPLEEDTMAGWLGSHLSDMLCDGTNTLAEVRVGTCAIRVSAREVAMQRSLRALGEVKLVGEIEVNCLETGTSRASWRSRAVIMRPDPTLSTQPAPDPNAQARMQQVASSWRALLQDNLTRRLADGPRRFNLSDVIPPLSLQTP